MKQLFFILFLLPLIVLNAQIDFSGSNLLRYGSGEHSIGSLNRTFLYRENLTELKLNLPSNFTIGARVLYDEPPETGISFKGLSRRFIGYKDDIFEARLGNSSELYGKGLALNLFENRGLAYNTWIDGIKAKYIFGNLKTSVIFGNIDFSDSTVFLRKEEYSLYGGNAEYRFSKAITSGISLIHAKGSILQNGFTNELKADVTEAFLSIKSESFSWLIDLSNKWTGVIKGKSANGYGIYSALNFNLGGVGVSIDYKDYRYDERDPYERNDFSRATRMLPFQNPPTVMKEHSYLFLSRLIHEIDFNDEAGIQMEMFYAINDDTRLNLNASASSRHNYYKFDQSTYKFVKETRVLNNLPSMDDKYSPFSEVFLEAEHSFSEATSINIGIANRSNIIYNDFTGESGSHKIISTVVPFLLQQSIGKIHSLTLEYEFEAVFDNYNSSQNHFTNQFVSLLTNVYSKFMLGLRYEFSNNNNDVSGRKDWFTIEAGYRLFYSNNISISYGRERGGQTCSNGVCRYVQPFEGVRFSILSTF